MFTQTRCGTSAASNHADALWDKCGVHQASCHVEASCHGGGLLSRWHDGQRIVTGVLAGAGPSGPARGRHQVPRGADEGHVDRLSAHDESRGSGSCAEQQRPGHPQGQPRPISGDDRKGPPNSVWDSSPLSGSLRMARNYSRLLERWVQSGIEAVVSKGRERTKSEEGPGDSTSHRCLGRRARIQSISSSGSFGPGFLGCRPSWIDPSRSPWIAALLPEGRLDF